MIVWLTYIAYYCLTKDKLSLLPIWVSLLKVSEKIIFATVQTSTRKKGNDLICFLLGGTKYIHERVVAGRLAIEINVDSSVTSFGKQQFEFFDSPRYRAASKTILSKIIRIVGIR
mgnify:CR=1 FL=1